MISPREVGLPALGRRRVPGLRREELAQLAGVSPDYYIRLEQGRSRNVSDAVLDAVARVLHLGPTEREHLFNLARPASKAAAPPRQRIRPGVRLLLDSMERIPAFVLGRRMDVLAWNALGDAVNGFSSWPAPNAARHAFLTAAARDLYAYGSKVLRHPEAGELNLTYETLALPGDPDQMLVAYAAPMGSPTHQRLLYLAADTQVTGQQGAARTSA